MRTWATRFLPLLLAAPLSAAFPLASPSGAATVLVPAGEPEFVRLAAEDLIGDVRRITGQTARLVRVRAACPAPCVVIGSVEHSAALIEGLAPQAAAELRGKWEAHRGLLAGDGTLLLAGSNARGAMFAVYHFLEETLGVDPMHHWSGLTPAGRARIDIAALDLRAGEPTFRFRGWFLNDEDLLTEFEESGGVRFLAYPYYNRIISPGIARRVMESAVRLRFNLIIPASFVDITNPAEAALIDEATRRGLFVSMHHVEPMGVSGFGFQNYWRLRGRNVPYSMVTHASAFEEIWRYYASHWARYPDVIWQLGLRGIGDRPVWVADPNVPPDMASRGKLISDAMAKQWEIVKSVDKRPQPLATTTLWAEGAQLHRDGHLAFPPGVGVIFADNGPGWKWEPDFFSVERQPGRPYGVYQHHQYWAAGPHLAQGVSPALAHRQVKLAVEHGSHWYIVLNVGNIREFILGIAASAEMTRDFSAFDPEVFMRQWVARRFGETRAKGIAAAYQSHFGAFIVPEDSGTPILLDGHMLGAAKRYGTRLQSRLRGAADTSIEKPETLASLAAAAEQQRAAWAQVLELARIESKRLKGEAAALLENNLIAQTHILRGLAGAAAGVLRAAHAVETDQNLSAHLETAAQGMAEVREGQKLASRGAWQHWYCGDRKMYLDELEAIVRDLTALSRQTR